MGLLALALPEQEVLTLRKSKTLDWARINRNALRLFRNICFVKLNPKTSTNLTEEPTW